MGKRKALKKEKLKKTEKREKDKKKYWISLTVLFMVIGFIACNSMYIGGYDCEKAFGVGDAVSTYYGYELTDSSFHYTGDEGSYIAVNALDYHVDRIMLTFTNCPDQDIDVAVSYLDENGDMAAGYQPSSWKWRQNEYYLEIGELARGSFNGYIVQIPGDFTLDAVYYAQDAGSAKAKRILCYVAVLILSFLLSALFVFTGLFKGCLAAENKIWAIVSGISGVKKRIPHYTICFCGTVLAGELAAYILGRTGTVVYSGKLAAVAFFCSMIIGMLVFFHRHLQDRIELIGFFVILFTGSALGMAAARGLGLPFHRVLYIGRWMNTLFLAAISYWSMRKLRTGKLVVQLIALIPTNLFMAANFTYDIWLTGWSMFGLSYFFGEWQQPEKKISWKASVRSPCP